MTEQGTRILQTERLSLRVFSSDDVDAFAAIEADPEVMRYYSSGPRPREKAVKTVNWFIQLQEKLGYSLWCLEKLGQPGCIGYCGLVQQTIAGRPEIEIGYKLAKELWDHGFTTEAATGVRDWAFANLAAKRLISIIDPLNVASVRVAEKIGMRYVQNVEYDGKECRIYAVSRPLS